MTKSKKKTDEGKSGGGACESGTTKKEAEANEGAAAEAGKPDEKAVLADRLLRLQADFENYRKRMLRERDDLYQRANEDLLLEVLPALDHMELALKAADEHGAPEAFVVGFRLVNEQLRSSLEKFGLTPVAAEGELFDPNRHEAISQVPSDEVPEGHVLVQTRQGYMHGDMLLRASQVVVSGGPAKAAPAVGSDGATQ